MLAEQDELVTQHFCSYKSISGAWHSCRICCVFQSGELMAAGSSTRGSELFLFCFTQRAALKEKAKPFDRSEQTTMTGLSLQGRGEEDEEGAPAAPQRREVETSTSLSLVSRRDEHTMTSQSLGTDQVGILTTEDPLGIGCPLNLALIPRPRASPLTIPWVARPRYKRRRDWNPWTQWMRTSETRAF